MDLGFEGANAGDEMAVGDLFGFGNGCVGNEEDCAVASGYSGADALDEAANVVGESSDPGGGIRAGGV